MKLLSYLLYLFCLFPATLPAQAPSLSTPDRQADFDILRKAMEEAHGGLYRFADKASWDKRFAAYRAKLATNMDQHAFIGLLSELLADTRDGHMRWDYDEATTAALTNARLLPLSTFVEGNKLVVLYNDTPADSTIRPGMEIISINGRPTGDLIKRILPKLSGDGFIETGKARRLERSFATHYWVYIDQASSFVVTAKDKSGKLVSTTLPGILNTDRRKHRGGNPVNPILLQETMFRMMDTKYNVSLQFGPSTDIATLSVRYFDEGNFQPRIDSAFRVLHEKKTKALILDLRGNGGGVDMYGAFLVSQFTDKPFRYFDRIHLTSIRPSFATWKPQTFDDLKAQTTVDPTGGYFATTKLHPGVGLQQPAEHPFLGKVIVLMDGATFSTAADVTALLRHLTRAKFVGEESGGGYEGNTSGLNALIRLPHSKLSLKIQMYEYWNAVPLTRRGRGTLPDYPVERKVEDMLKGIDAQWNKAMELAKAAL